MRVRGIDTIMPSFIHSIETAVPENVYPQGFTSYCMQHWIKDARLQRLARRVYKNSGINYRYSVLPDFLPGKKPLLFREDERGLLNEPSTGERNAVYEKTYQSITEQAVTKVFADCAYLTAEDVTHVITVSCTGFTNPGPDLFIKEKFGLSPSVERYHVGFMGCYAAFPALRMADQFCRASPDSVVLIVCIELCTLHMQINAREDTLLANALFADGAAAVLVSSLEPAPSRRVLSLDVFSSRTISSGEKDMAWTIGDHGFDMTLSPEVPRILGLNAVAVMGSMLTECESSLELIDAWAVHPGGKAILRALEKSLRLKEGGLHHSHEVLREFGNMSSATILFVFKRIMDEAMEKEGATIAAAAFGPGITVEFGLLKAVGPAMDVAPIKSGKKKVDA